MILNSEIIIYCSALTYTLPWEAEIISKDFAKRDHDNNHDEIEVSGAYDMRDDLNFATRYLQISFGARILSSLMRMALGNA